MFCTYRKGAFFSYADVFKVLFVSFCSVHNVLTNLKQMKAHKCFDLSPSCLRRPASAI